MPEATDAPSSGRSLWCLCGWSGYVSLNGCTAQHNDRPQHARRATHACICINAVRSVDGTRRRGSADCGRVVRANATSAASTLARVLAPGWLPAAGGICRCFMYRFKRCLVAGGHGITGAQGRRHDVRSSSQARLHATFDLHHQACWSVRNSVNRSTVRTSTFELMRMHAEDTCGPSTRELDDRLPHWTHRSTGCETALV